jgi:glycosyltransferase involved in cell wall biosynthesis
MVTKRSEGEIFISVIIPAFNESAHIGAAIGSIQSAFAENREARFEIVVCDNNSTDETGKLAAAAGARVVFESHNQIARARNAAAREAKGEWLIFMDADSRLSPALLGETLQRIRSGTTGGGGAVVAFDRADVPRHANLGLGMWNAISRTMNWAAGSYVFCRREAWADTGGFWERWYAGEEIPFSRRLKGWCRRRRLRFRIIRSTPLITSARKLDRYSPGAMFWMMARLAIPGALRKRENCAYWYRREEGK